MVGLLRSALEHEGNGVWESAAPHFALASMAQPFQSLLETSPQYLLRQPLSRGPPSPLGLRQLPSSFEQLFHESSQRSCALCGIVPDSRAICLTCGTSLCGFDTAHGPRACISHAATCGAGSALFVLTNNSAVVLARERRVMLLGSPYRDAHGEIDLGLLRGKPLTLVASEYSQLTRQWLALSFDETAKVEDEGLPGF